MRNLIIILITISICGICACKKSKNNRKDFREKYVGTFKLTQIHIQNVLNNPVAPSDTDTTYSTVAISYTFDQNVSIDQINGHYSTKLPAMTFTYNNGNIETVGVDKFGTIYRGVYKNEISVFYSSGGGFIGTDSINTVLGHTIPDFYDMSKMTFNTDSLWGNRIE